MAAITASMVAELRAKTDAPMMECKKALTEADGDMAKAEEILRVKLGSKASKAASRVAAEGVVAIHVAGAKAAIVEVNSETDFVAKDTNFKAFVSAVAAAAAGGSAADVEALAKAPIAGADTVAAAREGLVMKLGENISVRRFARIAAKGRLAHYLHGSKIGVLIDFEGGDEQLGKDLAMHIAASKPICVDSSQVPAETIAKEREIYSAQAKESGKPDNIVAKMVDGRISKFLAEVTLLGQPFVKNPDETVEKLLKAKQAKVHAFHMYVVGEGIEKKKDDFVAEVMAAAGSK